MITTFSVLVDRPGVAVRASSWKGLEKCPICVRRNPAKGVLRQVVDAAVRHEIMRMRIPSTGRRDAWSNKKRRAIPPLGADCEAGFSDASMCVREAQVRRGLLVMRIASMIASEVVRNLLTPNVPITFKIPGWYRPVL